ncbi:MAG TPA: 5'-methylthioadenosine/S-adenosylhomocysteine nucleosidase [Bacillota bacterium]|nr:5'-methylthioadenosine/S-adenosylhomocysteine nucleosidase [Bacillota bacterium]
MTIGIIAAMDEEIVYLKNKLTITNETKIAQSLFIEGELADRKVVLLKSGIGKVNAAMSTTILHEKFKPNLVVNTGSAGGLSHRLSVGDIVISSEVIHHDVDATVFNYEYGQVPGMPHTYHANERLVHHAKQVLKKLQINASVGMIGTGDSFMSDDKYVKYIKEKIPSLIAAEMEAASIAQVCFQYGTPFVIIRALSDIAGKDANISFDEFLDTAAKNSTRFIIEFVKSMNSYD